MQKLLKETGIAGAVYFALSWGLGFGIDEGEGWPEAAMAACIFAVIYFAVGLAFRYFRGRSQ